MMCSIRSLIGPLPNFTLPDGFIVRGTNEADMAQIADAHNGAFGVILVATFVGVANFVILRIFQVPNAVMLGFIMGITTILPLIGGYLGAGLSTLLALLSAPVYALIAFGSFVAVQQIENHILTPRVMSRSVGLNPLLISVCLFIGSDLGGIVGALIVVPIAGTIMILMRHLVIEPRKQEALPQFIRWCINRRHKYRETAATRLRNSGGVLIQVLVVIW
jgi:predicted PurR-regulated permease PerM